MRPFTNESAAIAYLTGLLKGKPECYVQKIGLRQTSGFPDLVVGFRGQVIFYEVKIVRKGLAQALHEVTAIQKAVMSKMSQAGMKAMVLIIENKDRGYLYYPIKYDNPNGLLFMDAITPLGVRWKENPLLPFSGSRGQEPVLRAPVRRAPPAFPEHDVA